MNEAAHLAIKLAQHLEAPKPKQPSDRIWECVQANFPVQRQRLWMEWAMQTYYRRINQGATEAVVIACLNKCKRSDSSPWRLLNATGALFSSMVTRVGGDQGEQESAKRKKEEREMLALGRKTRKDKGKRQEG